MVDVDGTPTPILKAPLEAPNLEALTSGDPDELETYGHSTSWAHSHASTHTRGGVMPDIELAAVAMSEPHAASFRQQISPSRSP